MQQCAKDCFKSYLYCYIQVLNNIEIIEQMILSLYVAIFYEEA